MSAATLDDFISVNHQDSKCGLHAERARILETVARKAQDKTLTLEETTDLYQKFNNTYEASNSAQIVDESWALELLQESEREDITKAYQNSSFLTRVNGVPHEEPSATSDEPSNIAHFCSEESLRDSQGDEAIVVEEKAKLRHEISFEPYVRGNIDMGVSAKRKPSEHQVLATVVGISGIATLSILLAFAWFI